MSELRRVVLSLAAGLLPVFAADLAAEVNRWSPHGPEGGSVRDVVVDPSDRETLYAATSDGVFRSTDGAGTWVEVSLQGMTVLIVDPANPSVL